MVHFDMYNQARSEGRLTPAAAKLIDREISIEVGVEQALKFQPDPSMFPAGSRVFLPHLQGKDPVGQVNAAKRLKDYGYVPVPHLGARNFKSAKDFVAQVECYSALNLREALFLGGNPSTAAGPLTDAMQLLAHPVLSNSSIKTAYLGGYPEGHPAISAATLAEVLRRKLDLCAEKNLGASIVSQFAFDGKVIGGWVNRIRSDHPNVSIRIGLAGVASLPTLVKFALMCGIGPSLAALRGSGGRMINILTEMNPAGVIRDIEAEYRSSDDMNLHFFPFGGWRKTLEWVSAARNAGTAQDRRST